MATADALAREAAKKKLATTKAFGLTATPRAPAKPKVAPYTGADLALDLVPGGRFVANTVETLKGNKVSPEKMQSGYIGMLPVAGGIRAASTALGATKAGARAIGAVTPAGLQAVAQTAKMTRRSPYGTLENLVDPVLREQRLGSAVSGPGTYFAQNKAASFREWGPGFGTVLSKPTMTPAAALKVAQSKGYMDIADFKTAMEAAGKTAGASQIKDPAVQELIQQGYIGVQNPGNKSATSWLVGAQDGLGTKKLGQLHPQTNAWLEPTPIQAAQNKLRMELYKKGELTQFMSPAQINKKLIEAAKKEALAKLKRTKPETYVPTIEG